MTDQPTERESVVYDAIDAFQRTHRLPGLQHAQIRGLLAEHLARVLPAAFADLEPVVPVSSPPPDQTLRDRIAEAVQHGPTWMLPRSLAEEVADAVLAVLPPPADRAAVLREAADRYAQLVDENEAYDREHGQLDETARVQHGAVRDVVVGLRRLAAEPPQQDTETRPQRGDQFEAWLKAQRDAAADYPEAYQATDGLLDLYRLHADTGTPLDQHACEGKHCDCPPAATEPDPQPVSEEFLQHLATAKVREDDGAEAQQPDTETPELSYTHTDDDGDKLTVGTTMAGTLDGEASVVTLDIDGTGGGLVYVRPERVEEVVAALRAAGRAALAAAPAAAGPGRAADTHHDEEGGRG